MRVVNAPVRTSEAPVSALPKNEFSRSSVPDEARRSEPDVSPHHAKPTPRGGTSCPEDALRFLPQFPLNPDDVHILYSPGEFQKQLLQLYATAARRIVLAALYVGTGDPERQVVSAIVDAYHQRQRAADGQQDPLKIDVLIDAVRGTRNEAVKPPLATQSATQFQTRATACSLDVLRPLLELSSNELLVSSDRPHLHHGLRSSRSGSSPPATSSSDDGNIHVHLFHSPLLSGLLYRILPARINEIMGVFHTKIFLADDSVILTGANLSESYLTNRQDRYVVIRNAPYLATFLHRFIQHIQRYSYKVDLYDPSLSVAHGCLSRQPDAMSWDVPLSSDYAPAAHSTMTAARVQFVDPSLPNPITEPDAFRQALGTGLRAFLEAHQHIVADHQKDLQRQFCGTTLRIALQVGFASPPLLQEETLFQQLLAPPSSPLLRCTAASKASAHRYTERLLHSFWTSVKATLQWVTERITHHSSFKLGRGRQLMYVESKTSQSPPVTSSFRRQSSVDEEDQSTISNNARSSSSSLTSLSSVYSSSCSDVLPCKGNLKHLSTPSFCTHHENRDGSNFVSDPLWSQKHVVSLPSSSSGDSQPSCDTLWRYCDAASFPFEHRYQKIVFASGYLNMRDQLLQLLSHAMTSSSGCSTSLSVTELDIFVAAPDANSFHCSKGLSKYIPMAYSYVGSQQLTRLRALYGAFLTKDTTPHGVLLPLLNKPSSLLKKSPPLCFREYSRPGWTFHSKGLWLYPSSASLPTDNAASTTLSKRRHTDHGKDISAALSSLEREVSPNQLFSTKSELLPMATVVGSSNYGLRSSFRDLDMSFFLHTSDPRLRRMLHQEVLLMQTHSSEVLNGSYLAQRCPLWLRFLLRWTGLKTLL